MSVFGTPLGAGGAIVTDADPAQLNIHRNEVNEILALIGGTGLVEPEAAPSLVENAIRLFNGEFPPTAVFSEFARQHSDTDSSDPDVTLMKWWETEKALFHGFERRVYEQRVTAGLDFDFFLSFSLSVHNRRKSRAGHALQNHLKALFDQQGIKYSFNQATEGKRTPDFVLPSTVSRVVSKSASL